MDFSPGQFTQLIVALFLGVVLFLVAYLTRPKLAIFFLLLMLPFQIISSRYGTLNMVLVYIVAIAWMLRGHLRLFPLLGSVVAIFFVYLMSLTQALRATYFDHVLYLVTIGGSFLFFYVSYNYFRREPDVRSGMLMFLWLNVMVLAYCTIQLIAGDKAVAFLGVQEFAFTGNLVERQRLIGPFGSAGTNGEYFALNIVLLCYLLMHRKSFGRLWMLVPLALGNIAFLIATGSRGSFLALLIGLLLFMLFFRRQLGFGGSLRVMGVGALGIAIVGAAVVRYTDFNVLFERLGETSFESGVPDTRQEAFAAAIERIPENLILGHGPRLRLLEEYKRPIKGYVPLPFPHNLILFLLVTVGTLGLLVWTIFFARMAWIWMRRKQRLNRSSSIEDGLPTLALLLLAVFLIDQLKIEFLRWVLADMQQFMFALWGMLLGLTEKQLKAAAPVRQIASRRFPMIGSRAAPAARIQQEDSR